MNDWPSGFLGGVLIGCSAVLLLWSIGRIAGISGIASGAIEGAAGDRAWRVAFLTGIHHIYIAAALTIIIKVIVIPRILKNVIERLNVSRELVMNVNIPASLLICGGLVMLAFFITQPIIPLGFLLTRDSLAIALAIILIGFFTMIARKKAVTQVIGFLVMENGLFLGATAAAYGMPLIVELGVFFDVLVGALIVGIYSHRLQDAFDSVDTSKLTALKE